MNKMYISKTIKDTHAIAQNIIKEMVNLETFVNQSKLIVLKGDLGVGKTEFVKGLAKFLKVKNNVLSPTFVLSKVYDIDFEGTKKLYHLDLYRLIQNNKVDGGFLTELCLEEKLIDKTNLIVIE
jgi:tRNA threonylcarbamoyladenosine biosynthesis protein TsaE